MQPPAIINQRYRLGRCLSQKPGRATYLAHDEKTNQPVVVKLLVFSYDFDWQWLKLFEREAQLLRQLQHPGIPRYLDYCDIDEPNFKGFALVQTYIDAPSLSEQIRQGRRFSTNEVRQLAVELLEILIYLQEHQPPVLHRDIKPSNVLMCDRTAHSPGRVYLVDFGAAQAALPAAEGTFTVVGSYGYTAPEQFAGRATAASDLYSLGATLVHLITGRHPADVGHKRGELELTEVLSDDLFLRQWLQTLLSFDPEERFSNASIALSSLQMKQADRSAVTTVPTPSKALCSIRKSSKTFTVWTPLEPSLPLLRCCILILGIVFTLMIVASVSPDAVGPFFLITWGVIIFSSSWIKAFLREQPTSSKAGHIELHIDDRNFTLSKIIAKKSEKDYEKIRLERYPRTGSFKVERVTANSVSVEGPNGIATRNDSRIDKAYVQILIQGSRPSQPVTLLPVGNRRSYWLSEVESKWLATELSNWLNCPVVEVEVREK